VKNVAERLEGTAGSGTTGVVKSVSSMFSQVIADNLNSWPFPQVGGADDGHPGVPTLYNSTALRKEALSEVPVRPEGS